MKKLTVKEIDLSGKKVILRADFNVPMDDRQNITDDRRIQASLPTIQYILEQNPAKVILMSHLGRPKGEVIDGLRLTPVAAKLRELLSESIQRGTKCHGSKRKMRDNCVKQAKR